MSGRASIHTGRKRQRILAAAAVFLGLAGIGAGIASGVIPVPSFDKQPGATGPASVTRVYAHLPVLGFLPRRLRAWRAAKL